MTSIRHLPSGEAVMVEVVAAEVVRPLRHAVLRPGWPDDESVYPGDGHPWAAHVAVRSHDGAEVLAVGTVLTQAPPWEPEVPAWRIRGMAAVERRRGQGLGALVLEALIDHVKVHGGGVVWCNARIKASTFYERAGFVAQGDTFDLPGIGEHRQMWRRVEV
jgi:GNAT superfamily N-acetyltransferase